MKRKMKLLGAVVLGSLIPTAAIVAILLFGSVPAGAAQAVGQNCNFLGSPPSSRCWRGYWPKASKAQMKVLCELTGKWAFSVAQARDDDVSEQEIQEILAEHFSPDDSQTPINSALVVDIYGSPLSAEQVRALVIEGCLGAKAK